ncbi:phage tail spike protein, partial [Lactococcus lactis]|uniref:phage tail spike protein n=1 Tax=Lactococcus lactis TaxID=1358 RepID=UPI0028906E0F
MTYPILYSPVHTDFNNLGLGVMIDCTSASVTEELNGKFELDIKYLANGPLAQYLVNDAQIKVDTGDQTGQLFRIKTVGKKIDGIIPIHAEHVSYITNDLPIKPSTTVMNSVAQVALNKMLSAIADNHPLTAYSDITTISSTEWKVPDFKTPRNILGGVKGSILDNWGGEYQFNNYQIRLMSQRGQYSNTIIAYGRNLTDFEQEESILETYTSIYPYANESSGSSTVLRTLPEFFVDSEYVNKYPNRRVSMVDFSNKFNDKNPYSEDKLRKLAQSYVKANKVGVPKFTMKVSTVDLDGSLDDSYNVAEVESLHLADTVKVFFEPLGITAEAKVVGSVWNVLIEQYDSYTLGAKKSSFGQWVNDNVKEIKNAADSAKQTAINAAISANGKNTNYYGNSGEGFPANPKVGDLYFQRNGDKTTVYQWDGSSWVNIIDGNWQSNFEQEMQGKLDQAKEENNAAMTELDKQLSDAQTAIANVDASNKTLVSAVDQAKKDIKAVDNAASQAMTTALDGKSLAETAKALGQNVLDQFNALSVGGRNLVLNSALVGDGTNGFTTNLLDGTEDFSGTWANSSFWVTDGTYKGLTVKKRTARWQGIYKTFTVPKDGTYTFSAYVKASGSAVSVYRYVSVNGDTGVVVPKKRIGDTFNWLRDSFQVTLKTGDTIYAKYEITGNGTDSILWTAGHKWEQGPTQVPGSWTKGGATATSKLVSITDLNQITTGVEITQTTLGQSGLRSYNFIENIQPNASYAQSFWIKNVDSNSLNMVVEIAERNKETNEVTYSSTKQVVPANSGWVRLSRVFTTKNTTNGLYFYLYTDTTTTNAHYILAAPKLEFGNIVTDWSAAPEDTQVKIERLEDGLKTTVSQSKYNADQTAIDSKISSVTQTANSVNSIVTNLTNGMPTGSSIISQISNSVSILVQKNDVINQINVSTEGILISGSKVHITGTTLIDDAIITTAMVKSLDASVITTGTLAANLIAPNAGNLLMNTQFNSTNLLDGWRVIRNANMPQTFTRAGGYNAPNGILYETVRADSLGGSNGSTDYCFLAQNVRAYSGVPYSASVVAYINDGSDKAEMGIYFLDSSGTVIQDNRLSLDSRNSYQLFKIENIIAPTGTTEIRFQVGIRGNSRLYFSCTQLNMGVKAGVYTPATGKIIVNSDMIVDGAIIAKHLAVGSITAEKLAVGAVNMASATVTGTLDANRINVINLDASQIKVGTLDAAVVRIINLDAGAITTGTLNVAVRINANSIVSGTLNAKLLTGDTAHLNS